MDKVLDFASWRHSPPPRLPGETLENHIIRRAARMRKVQVLLAVLREEVEALDPGQEIGEIGEVHDRLMDEEMHLWLRPGEETIQFDHDARRDISLAIIRAQNALEDARDASWTTGRLDEVHRLEAEEHRLWSRYEKIYRSDPDAVMAQGDLGDRSQVCHHSIRQDLLCAQNAIAAARAAGHLAEVRHLTSQERQRRELWERACRDAAEAREELLAQGLIRRRAIAENAAGIEHDP